jgi:hypothetical protein
VEGPPPWTAAPRSPSTRRRRPSTSIRRGTSKRDERRVLRRAGSSCGSVLAIPRVARARDWVVRSAAPTSTRERRHRTTANTAREAAAGSFRAIGRARGFVYVFICIRVAWEPLKQFSNCH